MRLGKKREVLGQRFKIISGGRYLHGTGAMSLERSRTALELSHGVLEIGNFKNCRDRGVLDYMNEKET